MPRKSKFRIIAGNLWHNAMARWRLARGDVASDIGSTHQSLSTEQSVEYIERVYRDYLEFGRRGPAELQGKRILELGPGDNLGVALRLYAAGASQVICLDKFYARRDEEQQKAIYASLRQQLTVAERARYDTAVDLSAGIIFDPACIRYIYGTPAERCAELLGEESVDIVVSRAVLWEIHDIDGALAALDRVLRPGGVMLHKIACLDWMFRQNGYHPLEFLTVPDWLYRLISQDSGKSNRCTIDYYRQQMQTRGYSAEFQIVRVVGCADEFGPGVSRLVSGTHYSEETLELLRQIRPRLQGRFGRLCEEDLMVEDMFMVAVKSRNESAAQVAG